MSQIKIINVVGARPNFIKIAPLMEEIKKDKSFKSFLVHTGQHYDLAMSKLFFKDLEIPEPDINLGVGSGSHSYQTAKIMMKFEKVVNLLNPSLVLVVGDVNSTLACSLVAAKMGVKIAHVEAGLRSFDRSMPEEINRVLVDSLADFLFITERDARDNLKKEGIPSSKIYFVGNVMIDTLFKYRRDAGKALIKKKLGLESNSFPYALLTLHRPSNVDDRFKFYEILDALKKISESLPIIFPSHPRTKKQIQVFGFQKFFDGYFSSRGNRIGKKGIYLVSPLGYLNFLSLLEGAKIVFTDSGGIQEETTFLGVPCLTLRENTERPITVNEGSNQLVGTEKEKIIKTAFKVLDGGEKRFRIPKFWDGKASRRIVSILKDKLS